MTRRDCIVFDVINFNNVANAISPQRGGDRLPALAKHFCLINIDKCNNVLKLVDQTKLAETKRNNAAINKVIVEREEADYFRSKQA